MPTLFTRLNPTLLDTALNLRYRHMPHYRGRMRRAMLILLDAIAAERDVETYAQIKYGFWYKVYFFTPVGALKSDTNGEQLNTTAMARRVIAAHDLRRVPMSAVFKNWQMGDLWEERRPLSAILLDAWKASDDDEEAAV